MAALFAAASLISFAARGQNASLSVTGEVKEPLKLTMAELEAMPTAKVTAKDHDGTPATYEGVPLHAILNRAGVPQGEALRGEALQTQGLIERRLGHLEEAGKAFEQSLAIARQNDDKFLAASDLLNLGQAALQMEHYDESVALFNESA